jgi:hypothetical protein
MSFDPDRNPLHLRAAPGARAESIAFDVVRHKDRFALPIMPKRYGLPPFRRSVAPTPLPRHDCGRRRVDRIRTAVRPLGPINDDIVRAYHRARPLPLPRSAHREPVAGTVQGASENLVARRAEQEVTGLLESRQRIDAALKPFARSRGELLGATNSKPRRSGLLRRRR